MNLNQKDKIIFLGTSEFAVPALEALVKKGYEVIVVTIPDAPAGRKQVLTPPPIKLKAESLKLKVFQPEKLKEIFQVSSYKLQADAGIVASYGKIIPKEIIDLFPKGLLNIHPSLLPKYRGPSPIQYALLNGDKETGVTIMKIDEELDHGPIVTSCKLQVASYKLYEELEKELSEFGAELLMKTLPNYLAGKIKLQKQDHSQATFTKIIKKEDGKIDWHKSAEEIHNQFRAFHKWPGIWFEWQGKILKIINCARQNISGISSKMTLPIGTVFQENGRIFVQCSNGQLELLKLQLEGGNALTAKEFLNGYGHILKRIL